MHFEFQHYLGAERVASILGNYHYERGNNIYFFVGDYKGRKKYSVKGTIVNTGICNSFHGSMSPKRAKHYSYDRVIRKWNCLIEG